jgi:hypothetical protein
MKEESEQTTFKNRRGSSNPDYREQPATKRIKELGNQRIRKLL